MISEKLSFYIQEIENADTLGELKYISDEINTDHKIPIILKNNLKMFLVKRTGEIKE